MKHDLPISVLALSFAPILTTALFVTGCATKDSPPSTRSSSAPRDTSALKLSRPEVKKSICPVYPTSNDDFAACAAVGATPPQITSPETLPSAQIHGTEWERERDVERERNLWNPSNGDRSL